jgi:hypothetical protein
MAKKGKLVKYVSSYLDREFLTVNTGPIADLVSVLSLEERTLIYKYFEDGYEGVNSILRKSLGKNNTEFGRLLDNTLRKLPDYKGVVYRSVNLTSSEIEKYEVACEKNAIFSRTFFYFNQQIDWYCQYVRQKLSIYHN